MRAYAAFYLGPEAVPWQGAPTPERLVDRLGEVEREVAGAGGGFWSCPVAGCGWSSRNPMGHPCPHSVMPPPCPSPPGVLPCHHSQ